MASYKSGFQENNVLIEINNELLLLQYKLDLQFFDENEITKTVYCVLDLNVVSLHAVQTIKTIEHKRFIKFFNFNEEFALKNDDMKMFTNKNLPNLHFKIEGNRYYIEIDQVPKKDVNFYNNYIPILFGYFKQGNASTWLFPSFVVVNKRHLKDKYLKIQVFYSGKSHFFRVLENGECLTNNKLSNANFPITANVVWQNDNETFLVNFCLKENGIEKEATKEIKVTDKNSDFYKIQFVELKEFRLMSTFFRTKNAKLEKELSEVQSLVYSFSIEWADELIDVLENVGELTESSLKVSKEAFVSAKKNLEELSKPLQSEHSDVIKNIQELREKHLKLITSILTHVENLSEQFSIMSGGTELNKIKEEEKKRLETKVKQLNSELKTLKKTPISPVTTTDLEDELKALKAEVSQKTTSITNLEQELIKKKKSTSVGTIVFTGVITFLVSSLIFSVYIFLSRKDMSSDAEAISMATIKNH